MEIEDKQENEEFIDPRINRINKLIDKEYENFFNVIKLNRALTTNNRFHLSNSDLENAFLGDFRKINSFINMAQQLSVKSLERSAKSPTLASPLEAELYNNIVNLLFGFRAQFN
jgi:hypothetical protein